jgi:hypothetical protein
MPPKEQLAVFIFQGKLRPRGDGEPKAMRLVVDRVVFNHLSDIRPRYIFPHTPATGGSGGWEIIPSPLCANGPPFPGDWWLEK